MGCHLHFAALVPVPEMKILLWRHHKEAANKTLSFCRHKHKTATRYEHVASYSVFATDTKLDVVIKNDTYVGHR
jgi:hypothetical protein